MRLIDASLSARCRVSPQTSTRPPLAGSPAFSPGKDLVLQINALVSSVLGSLRQGPKRTSTSCSAPMPGARHAADSLRSGKPRIGVNRPQREGSAERPRAALTRRSAGHPSCPARIHAKQSSNEEVGPEKGADSQHPRTPVSHEATGPGLAFLRCGAAAAEGGSLQVPDVRRPRTGRCVSRAAPEHRRGPARVREDRVGIRPARCLSRSEFARAPRTRGELRGNGSGARSRRP